MTKYTSFVAVDNEVVNKEGGNKKITQPLPLPQNLSNNAVGAAADVKGKSTASKTLTIEVESKSGLELSDMLRAKRWLNKTYGELLKSKNIKENIKISFSENDGVIVKFWKNGKWVKSDYWSGLLDLHHSMKGKQNSLTYIVKFK